MNKLLVTAAVAGLSALAFAPAVFAQDSAANQVTSEEFDQADVDNSGELSFEEAVSVLPTLTQEQFDQLDGNDNGTLSLAEIGDTPKDGSILSPATPSSEEPSAQ